MNHTITKTLAIAAVVVALIVIIPGYLHEIKAEAKTYSLSTSMSTDCNGETNESCQTTLCENDKPCHTIDSNSAQRNITIVCKDDNSCRTITNTP